MNGEREDENDSIPLNSMGRWFKSKSRIFKIKDDEGRKEERKKEEE